MEGLIENVDELKGKIKEKIIENKDLGFLSKKLATIITDVPVEYNFDDLKISEPNNDKILSIFDELEFKRLKETYKKLFNQNSNDVDNYDLFSNSSEEKVEKNILNQIVSSETSLSLLLNGIKKMNFFSTSMTTRRFMKYFTTSALVASPLIMIGGIYLTCSDSDRLDMSRFKQQYQNMIDSLGRPPPEPRLT